VLDLRLQPVVREISESHARTRDELESLYRKIVSYVLLRSGLGAATDVGVVREATGSFSCSRCYSRCGLLLSVSGRFVACLSAFCLLSFLLNENCHIVSAMKICFFGFTSAVIRSVVIGLRGSITSVAWSFGLLVTTIQPYKNG